VTITANDILPGLLEAAIRLHIMRLRKMDDRAFRTTFETWTNDTYIGISGLYDEEVLITTFPGITALAFNTLAKAHAALAFVPGGVTVLNTHYEATRP
jgi:hypothetical protein